METSEELRRQKSPLVAAIIGAFPHDLGPKGSLDMLCGMARGALRDPFPELKKLGCGLCCGLVKCEPQRMKAHGAALAKTLKLQCLSHKHSVVRKDGVDAFSALLPCGAVELLSDARDEPDPRTTVHALMTLCTDHSEPVRMAMVRFLSTALLDCTERLEQHRRLLPHVLLLLTDPSDDIRVAAHSVLLSIGKLHRLDHEDNRSDVEHRAVTLKDIEWYAVTLKDIEPSFPPCSSR